MMRAFPGFPDRAATTRIPTLWLRAVLAEAESLAELKVTLHALRLLDAKRTYPRYVRTSELRADATTIASLQTAGGLSTEDALAEGVRLAVARGVFLALPLRAEGEAAPEPDLCLFLNTPAHRQLVARIARGEQRLDVGPAAAPAVLPARRPTIYELYEQNVGLLTPLLVEELREAAETYPPEWLEEAFREAVGYNRRHWRYVRRILEKWAVEGRGDRGVAGGRPQAPRDPRRFIEGRYGHLVQH
ncbi:MAG TPA: DnaD domain protein [Chloroflexota bacterium]|jgi:DnaD/phage-associated family protein